MTQIEVQVREHGVYDFYDSNFRRLSYVRYADDFLVGVIASRKEAEEIKEQIKEFLRNELKLELNEEKTKIIHNSEPVRFLGYDIKCMRSVDKPELNSGITFSLPFETCKEFIINNKFGKFVKDKNTGKPTLKGIHRPELINLDELEIYNIFNSRIRGLYNYYKMASNVCKLNGFSYICQLSFLRTLSAKYKTSCAKLYANKNYNKRKNGAHIGITYRGHFYELFDGPFVVNKYIKYEKDIDYIENMHKYFNSTHLTQRLEAKKCEWCGDESGPFEVHHIKKLKDLKGKSSWEKLMISRHRKTMVLCRSCHDKLHAGKL